MHGPVSPCAWMPGCCCSLSAHFIHPDTDASYSGCDQHFFGQLTLSHANVTPHPPTGPAPLANTLENSVLTPSLRDGRVSIAMLEHQFCPQRAVLFPVTLALVYQIFLCRNVRRPERRRQGAKRRTCDSQNICLWTNPSV